MGGKEGEEFCEPTRFGAPRLMAGDQAEDADDWSAAGSGGRGHAQTQREASRVRIGVLTEGHVQARDVGCLSPTSLGTRTFPVRGP